MNTARYDNSKAKQGMNLENQPKLKDQREYMREKLKDFKFDGMPKDKNQLYHIVSKEWFEDWKNYVQMASSES